MIEPEKIIGKYKVIESKQLKTSKRIVEIPVLTTDNPREAVWIANKDPEHLTPTHICGERDFYRDDDGLWRSFEL